LVVWVDRLVAAVSLADSSILFIIQQRAEGSEFSSPTDTHLDTWHVSAGGHAERRRHRAKRFTRQRVTLEESVDAAASSW
jgi:hypothetical protein